MQTDLKMSILYAQKVVYISRLSVENTVSWHTLLVIGVLKLEDVAEVALHDVINSKAMSNWQWTNIFWAKRRVASYDALSLSVFTSTQQMFYIKWTVSWLVELIHDMIAFKKNLGILSCLVLAL